MNHAAIDRGLDSIVKITVTDSWKNSKDENVEETKAVPEFIKDIVVPINRQEGDKIPVSTFIKHNMDDGIFMHGTSAYEKRGIAVNVPEWDKDKCIQCNQCSFVCPHAAIRPFLLNEKETKNAPANFKIVPAKGLKTEDPLSYTIGVTPLDCTGCGNCAEVCPAPGKALFMKPQETQKDQIEAWNYAVENVENRNPMDKNTVKGSQFEQPLLEYSGACAGCGETPYAKLVTQLFGDRMMIANATGCSSIWAASAPSSAYTKNAEGHGPAWANSLFEDNAEFGLGMHIGAQAVRDRIAENIKDLLKCKISEYAKLVLTDWLEHKDISDATRDRSERVISILENENAEDKDTKELIGLILDDKEFLIKRSQWIFGGDGWAYDIGYGGLDHVLASGENVNILVFDTEIYSNTGGQSSKSTPAAAIAKFAATGKKVKKKDLGMMAMSYGYVYVAQISMGANKNQALKAIAEAENYNGPSLIIAYAPCISHGIKLGMKSSQDVEKMVVDCGYWHLYRHNPLLKEQGKNPFILDSKEPNGKFREYLMSEVRYASLAKTFPEQAEELFALTEENAMERLENYKRLAKNE